MMSAMSWDIAIMDLPRGLSPVSEIPDDCRPEPSRSALIKMICELASSADFVACLLHHLDLRAIDCSEGVAGQQRVGRWSGGANPMMTTPTTGVGTPGQDADSPGVQSGERPSRARIWSRVDVPDHAIFGPNAAPG